MGGLEGVVSSTMVRTCELRSIFLVNLKAVNQSMNIMTKSYARLELERSPGPSKKGQESMKGSCLCCWPKFGGFLMVFVHNPSPSIYVYIYIHTHTESLHALVVSMVIKDPITF